MRWFTPEHRHINTRYGDSHGIFTRIALLTLPFSALYILVSIIIGYHAGIALMMVNFMTILIILMAFRKTGRYRLSANLYLASCYFIAILGCSIFTGGIHSMVMPWFAVVPVASALILNRSTDTRLWTALSCLSVITYWIADLAGYSFPVLYSHAYTEFFNAICIVGLVLILSLFAIVFGNFIRQEKQFSDDIINNLPGMFCMLDEKGRFMRVNRQFLDVSGVEASELDQMTVQDFFDGQEKELIMQRIVNVFGRGSAQVEADFVTKSGDRLPYYFTGERIRLDHQNCMVGLGTDISERKRAEELVKRMALHDALTGLPNRALFSDLLQKAFAMARRDNALFALIFMDLDRFKPVNDELGHEIGDKLLTEVAGRIQSTIRESDTVARIGGDEFVVLLPLIEAERDPVQVAEKIRNSLSLPFEVDGHTLHISSSLGIAVYPRHGTNEVELMKNADIAMYRAKEKGRDNVAMYWGDS